MAEDETPPATPKHIEGQRAPDGAPITTPTAEHDKL
jgi:sec-independent protein translocase protein TatA